MSLEKKLFKKLDHANRLEKRDILEKLESTGKARLAFRLEKKLDRQ